jgi:hypothetical protein
MRLYQVGTRLSADLWSWGGRAELELGSGPVRPRVTGEAWDAPQGGYAGGTAGIAFLAGRWDGELGVGAWSTPDGDEITAVLRVRVLLPSGAEATLDAARYAPDPLLDTRVAGGGGASLAVPLARFGTGAEAAGAPVPNARDAARTVEGPAVRFFLPDPEATSASLVGDFSEWREIPMARVDGGWAVELDLGPGLYAYGFLVDGRWEVPEDLSGGRTDEWGRPEARVLVVAPDAATEDGP